MKAVVSIAGLAAAFAAVFVVPSASAHSGLSLGGTGTPTIDGVMTPGEWDGTGHVDFTAAIPTNDGGGTTPGTLYVMNDDSNLYIGIKVTRQGEPRGSFVVEFDNDHNGVFYEEGDDAFVANPGTSYFDAFRTMLPPCPGGVICGLLDSQVGGTSDGQSAAGSSGGAIVYEVSKPLDSADNAHDFSLEPGDTVGFTASVQLWSVVPACNFGSQCLEVTNIPASGGGDIRVLGHDSTPPVLSIPVSVGANATSPNGAVVSYTASATDDVDGAVPVSCVPASGATFAIGTTTAHCSASDAAGNAGHASFDVYVKGASEQLGDLSPLVTEVGPGTSLLDKLNAARAALAAGDRAATCDTLTAFGNEAKAQSGRKLTREQSSLLVTAASRTRAVLSC